MGTMIRLPQEDPYTYAGSYAVADTDDVTFGIEFLSAGCTGATTARVSLTNKKNIVNAGTALLGQGNDLRVNEVVCVSDIACLANEVETIKIRYTINGEEILLHTNPKSEQANPEITLYIQFVKP